ncbi:hypothetical protein FDUTEX481_03185 [Tolypothrix sp. PCC 7601]|nr:hypothetical protein FDUTEX481_03185 [Tolypothrix sp. PCC 7601]
MGHGALGMGHGALGMDFELFVPQSLKSTKNQKTSYSTKNQTIILEGVWGTQPSPNRGFGGESPK